MADDIHNGGGLLAALKTMAPFAPGVAGAVLSLAFGEQLTVKGKAASVATGLACAGWIAPLVVAIAGLFWPGPDLPPAVPGAASFLCGLFGMILFAGFAQALAKYARDPLRLVKISIGGVTLGGDLPAGKPEGGA